MLDQAIDAIYRFPEVAAVLAGAAVGGIIDVGAYLSGKINHEDYTDAALLAKLGIGVKLSTDLHTTFQRMQYYPETVETTSEMIKYPLLFGVGVAAEHVIANHLEDTYKRIID